jgi:hypothetical protein
VVDCMYIISISRYKAHIVNPSMTKLLAQRTIHPQNRSVARRSFEQHREQPWAMIGFRSCEG